MGYLRIVHLGFLAQKPATQQRGTESSLLSSEILIQHYKTAFSFVRIQIYVHLPPSLQDFQPKDYLLHTRARLAPSRYYVLLLILHLKSSLEEQSMLPMNQPHSIRLDTCKSQPSLCSWVGFNEKWLHPGKPPCKSSPGGWHARSAISSAAEGISKGSTQSCRGPGMQLLPLHARRCLAHIQLHLCTENKLRFVYTQLYRHKQHDGVKVTVWSKSSVQQS